MVIKGFGFCVKLHKRLPFWEILWSNWKRSQKPSSDESGSKAFACQDKVYKSKESRLISMTMSIMGHMSQMFRYGLPKTKSYVITLVMVALHQLRRVSLRSCSQRDWGCLAVNVIHHWKRPKESMSISITPSFASSEKKLPNDGDFFWNRVRMKDFASLELFFGSLS